jgi:RNA-directed DNA polymerase
VVSPLLANIVLNYMDWQLHHAGFAFVRYADDFVVVCQSPQRAEEARSFVETILDKLGLKPSPSKTKIVPYGKGYSFLGFFLSSRSRRMRPKSVRKFKDKVRELTPRKQNFEAKVIVKLNRVIGGATSLPASLPATRASTSSTLGSECGSAA